MDWINYALLLALALICLIRASSGNIIHPVMVSMFAGLLPFMLGVQMSVSGRPALAELYAWILVFACAGCLLGKKRHSGGACYEIASDEASARTHRLPYIVAVLAALAGIALMFAKKGVPILADEPNIAKVTFSQGGGWVLTRFVRYFLLTLFYCSILQAFAAARQRIRRLTGRDGETGLVELVRHGPKGWLVLGLLILALFSSLGYKANVIAFFLWTVCFIGLTTRIRLAAFVPFAAVGAVVSILVLWAIQNAEGLSELLVFIYMRSTTSAAEGLIHVLSSYGTTEPFLYGEGLWFDLSNILRKLGLQPLVPFELHELNFDAFIFEKILGHNEYRMQATTSLFGQLYANFGLPATLAGTFIFFFVFVRFADFLARSRKTVIGTPVYFLLFQQYQTFIAGGPVLITVFDTAVSIAVFLLAYAAIYLLMRLPTGSISFRIP